MAAFTRRVVPSTEMGLMPNDEVAGKRTFFATLCAFRNSYSSAAPLVPAANSMPA